MPALNSPSPRPRLILASASPRRAALLRQAGIEFLQYPSRVDESRIAVADHREFAMRAAILKARDVASRPDIPKDALVLGADTIVCLDERRLGKPRGIEEARVMLHALAQRRHEVITGVALCRPGDPEPCASDCATTSVWFGAIPEADLEDYLATEDPYDKAGAYGIQGWAGRHIARIEGGYDNVVGLPVARVAAMISEAGRLED